MIPLLIVAFVGWFIWVTSALAGNGRAVSELREAITSLKAKLDLPFDRAGQAPPDEAPPDEAPPSAPAPEPSQAAPQMQLEFETVPAESAVSEEQSAFAEVPNAESLFAEPTARPEPRQAPSLAWERAWRSVAGPLSGGRGDGSADIGGTEARLGTVWLSRVGVLLLMIGAVFAYRYGVTTNLHRMIIGYAAGIGLLALGYWGQRRHFRLWAQAITGGGLGLLYLTTTAGSALFQPTLIPQPIGFALMALTTALGTALAVWYNAQVVGLLSLFGGFATPFVLSTGGAGDLRLLFAYIAVLDAGLLLVAYFRRWPLYNYLVFLATWGIFGLWRLFRAMPGDWQWAMIAASVFFVIFALVSIAHCLIRRLRGGPAELLLAMVNGAVYFVLGLSLIDPQYEALRNTFPFIVAAIFLVLGVLTVRRNRDDKLMIFAFVGQAIVYCTVAFPIALHGSWITTAWAFEGALLVWLGFISDLAGVRLAGLIVLGLAAGRLATLDTFPERFSLPLLTPALRAGPFISVILALYIAAIAYARRRTNRAARDGLATAASFFTLWYLALEIYLRYQGLRPVGEALGSCGLTIAAVWAGYGLVLALVDLRLDYAGLRTGARLVLGLSVVIMAAAGLLREVPEIMGYLGIGVTAAATWVAELSFSSRGVDLRTNGGLSLATGAVTFGALALQVNRVLDAYLGQPPTLSDLALQFSTRTFAILAVLAVYVLAVMVTGMLLRSASARTLACALSALLSLSAAYGAVHLQAAWQVRALTFALIVPGAYLITWLSGRYGGRRPDWEHGAALLTGLAAALLTAWWGATELLRTPEGSLYFIDGPRFNLILIWLGGYALALGAAGMWLHTRAVRSLSAVIQWIALVFLLAVSALLRTPWATNITALATIVLGIYAENLFLRAHAADPFESRARLVLGLAACTTTLAWAATAIDRLVPPYGSVTLSEYAALSIRNHWLLIVAGLYSLAVVVAGLTLRSSATRGLGYVMHGLAIAGVMTLGLRNLGAPLALRVIAYVACVGGAYVATAMVRRAGARTEPAEWRATQWLSLAAAGLTVVWLAFQANAVLADTATASTGDFGISASWGVYGLTVLATGFALHNRQTRVLGLATLALTLGKIGIFDMWQLALTWRIWITVGLGIIFVTASLMYQRFARAILADDQQARSNAGL